MLDGSTLAPVAACQAAPGSAAWSHDGTEFAVKEETGDLVVLDPATCARRETLSGSHAAGGVADFGSVHPTSATTSQVTRQEEGGHCCIERSAPPR